MSRHARRSRHAYSVSLENLEARQLLAGNVSGLVWHDVNRDGIRDTDENLEYMVADVTVRLFTEAGVRAGVTTTGAEGTYQLSNIEPGNYYLEFELPPDTQYTTPADGSSLVNSDVDAAGRTKLYRIREGEVQDFVDAGIWAPNPPPDIQGFVWNDRNANGIREPGELPLAHQEVQLENARKNKLIETETDETGAYRISGNRLLPGEYLVDFVHPRDVNGVTWRVSPIPSGPHVDPTQANSAGPGNGKTVPFVLPPSDGPTEVPPVVHHGGFYPASSIQGQIWHDLDHNGALGDGETSNVLAVQVELRGANGELLATTQSHELGQYIFSEVRTDQDYFIQFVNAEDTQFSTPARLGPIRLTAEQLRVELPPTGIFSPLGSADLRGFVWEDLNANGVYEAGEQGLSNQRVQLFNARFQVVAQALTDQAGGYFFPGTERLPGEYLIGFIDSNDATQSDWRISPRARDADPNVRTNDAQPTNSMTPLFRLDPLDPSRPRPVREFDGGKFALGQIVGRFWDDADRDGRQSANELGISSQEIRLLGDNGREIARTLTQEGGQFSLTVYPGTYRLATDPFEGTSLESTLVFDHATGVSQHIAIQSRQQVDADLRLIGRTTETQLAGTVWNDQNGDGVRQSTEPAYAGLTVTVNSHTGLTQSMVTDTQGNYAFRGLAAGHYAVTATLPTNQVFSPFRTGTDATLDSDLNRWTGRSPYVTLVTGQQISSVDIGVYTGQLSTNVVDSLRVTEVGFIGHGNAEFTEVKNVGTQPISLEGVRFTNGIRFNFNKSLGKSLFPGEHAIVVGARATLGQRYNVDELNIAGEYNGDLNREERLTILDSKDRTVTNFRYNDDWFIILDNEYLPWTLTVIDEHASISAWDTAANWRPSSILAGTPGFDDPKTLPDPGTIVINEVLSKSTDGRNDLIEIHNTTDQPIDIGNWFLGDSDNLVDRLVYLTRYRIAPNTILPAHGYLVFSRYDNFGNSQDPGVNYPFGLSSFGEAVHLIAADEFGRMQGYSHSVYFDATQAGVTFGQLPIGDGSFVFTALDDSSFGASNVANPLLGPIVIDQIMYHANAEADDYIRIVNTGTATVRLGGGKQTWEIADGIKYTFDDGEQLTAGQHGLVVGIDPQTFRVRFGVPDSVAIFGPFSGRLSDQSDTLQVYRILEDDRRILADAVDYRDVSPWPLDADRGNIALTRRRTEWLGNDPRNWIATAITASAHLGQGAFGRQFAAVADIGVFTGNYLGMSVFSARPGDANGDGRFDSRDIVQVFQRGLYETGRRADWLAGDWNRDNVFDTRDLVSAFTEGSYLAAAQITDAAFAGALEEVLADSHPIA